MSLVLQPDSGDRHPLSELWAPLWLELLDQGLVNVVEKEPNISIQAQRSLIVGVDI